MVHPSGETLQKERETSGYIESTVRKLRTRRGPTYKASRTNTCSVLPLARLNLLKVLWPSVTATPAGDH